MVASTVYGHIKPNPLRERNQFDSWVFLNQALKLLRDCGHNAKEALTKWKDMAKNDLDHDFKLWSEEETRLFENGLLQYGKDFFKLHHFVVSTCLFFCPTSVVTWTMDTGMVDSPCPPIL
jgi:hypothetical protein